MSKTLSTFSLMILLCCDFAIGQTIVYDDGQEHILTQNVDNVIVTNQSKLDLQANVQDVDVDNATLVLNGGEIAVASGGGLTIRNRSNVSLNSGRAWEVDVDAATLVLDGASIYGDQTGLTLRNGSNASLNSGTVSSNDFGARSLVSISSTVHLNGATIGEGVFGEASTVLLDSGGIQTEYDGIIASGTTNVNVTGGSIWARGNPVILSDSAVLKFSGGVIQGLEGSVILSDAATFQLSGGVVKGESNTVNLSGAATFHVFGGTLEKEEGAHFVAEQDSRVTVHGSDFNFPLLEPIETLSGVITGTLADGSTIEWSFRREPSATIILVPEPSSQLLGMIGMLGRRLRRRCGKFAVRC